MQHLSITRTGDHAPEVIISPAGPGRVDVTRRRPDGVSHFQTSMGAASDLVEFYANRPSYVIAYVPDPQPTCTGRIREFHTDAGVHAARCFPKT